MSKKNEFDVEFKTYSRRLTTTTWKYYRVKDTFGNKYLMEVKDNDQFSINQSVLISQSTSAVFQDNRTQLVTKARLQDPTFSENPNLIQLKSVYDYQLSQNWYWIAATIFSIVGILNLLSYYVAKTKVS